MQLTPIALSESVQLQALAKRTYIAAFKSKNKPGVIETYLETAFAKAQLETELQNKQSYWYFAKNNTQLLGYLKLNTHTAQTEFKEPEGLEIERIYMDMPYLRKGIGGKLLDFSISKAKELRKTYIWLGVWEHNPDAIRFYKKRGFTITGTHDYDMIAEIQTDYIMRLAL